MEDNRKDYRMYKRFEAQLSLQINRVNFFDDDVAGTTVDLSPKVIRFITDKNLNFCEEFDLRIQLEDNGAVILRTRVVWSRLIAADQKYQIGVEIIGASNENEDRFIKHYCEKAFFSPSNES